MGFNSGFKGLKTKFNQNYIERFGPEDMNYISLSADWALCRAVLSAVMKHWRVVEDREFLYQLIFSDEELSCMKSDEINCEGGGGGAIHPFLTLTFAKPQTFHLVKNKLPALPHLETTATTCLRKLLKL